jgi:hypothetical protein
MNGGWWNVGALLLMVLAMGLAVWWMEDDDD